MVYVRALILPLILLTASTAAAQSRATNDEQVAIEMTATQYLAASKPRPAQGFLLDRRSYVLSTDVGIDGRTVFSKPSSEILPSHTAQHLDAIVRELTLAGVTAESDKCAPEEPSLCRLTTFPGLLSFGAATVHGNRAQISVSMWSKDDNPRSVDGLRQTTLHVTLESAIRVWRITSVKATIE